MRFSRNGSPTVGSPGQEVAVRMLSRARASDLRAAAFCLFKGIPTFIRTFHYFASCPLRESVAMSTTDFNRDQITGLVITPRTSPATPASRSRLDGGGVEDGFTATRCGSRVCQEPRSAAVKDFNHDDQLDVVLACR